MWKFLSDETMKGDEYEWATYGNAAMVASLTNISRRTVRVTL